jgi:hypothetical protein
MKAPRADAGKPLRTGANREIIRVKTDKGLVPFSVKRRNIRYGKGTNTHQMVNNLELKGGKAR